MYLALINLIQAQESPRISKLVIIGAVIVFIVGLSLLVYYFRRLKGSEKEQEEDWGLSRHSLFVNVPPPRQEGESEPAAAAEEVRGATRELASGEPPALDLSTAPEPKLPEREIETAPVVEEAPPHLREPQTETLHEERALSSPRPEPPEVLEETTPFDDDVWAGLENAKQAPLPSVQPVERESLPSVAEESVPPPVEDAEQRVEQRTGREPFEPPRIEPLTPREQAARTSERKESQPSATDLYATDPRNKKGSRTEPLISDREIQRQPPAPASGPDEQTSLLYSDRARQPATREIRGETVERAALSDKPVEPSVARARVERSRPAGSILGLPSESSAGPLILGEPARPADETGIGALTNYGKTEKGGSHAGTIALCACDDRNMVAAQSLFD